MLYRLSYAHHCRNQLENDSTPISGGTLAKAIALGRTRAARSCHPWVFHRDLAVLPILAPAKQDSSMLARTQDATNYPRSHWTLRKLRTRSHQEEILLIGFGYLLEIGVIATLILAGALLLRLVYSSIFH
jgi:hypothetical protein